MFDLEQAIAEWRRQMSAAGIESPATLDELESHLREEMERQMRGGHDPQESFRIACQCIGRADALGTEFKKAGSAREVLDHRLAQIVLYATGLAYGWVLFWALHALLQAPMGRGERLTGLAAVGLSIVAAFGGRFHCRWLPALPDKRFRAAIQAAGFLPAIVGLPLFAWVVLPHWDFNSAQMGTRFVVMLWIMSSLPLAFGLWKGLEEAADRTRQPKNQNV